jgi:hypothetical protein
MLRLSVRLTGFVDAVAGVGRGERQRSLVVV